MELLWAPWRTAYVQDIDKNRDGCIFCDKPKQSDDKKNLILYRGNHCFVVLNLYPYNNGHMMIVPYAHIADIALLDSATVTEMWELVVLAKKVCSAAINPDGFNIGMNLGRTAGAGIDQHLHMHIVPRWNGDVNFMATVGQTKVISQSLESAWEIFSPMFAKR